LRPNNCASFPRLFHTSAIQSYYAIKDDNKDAEWYVRKYLKKVTKELNARIGKEIKEEMRRSHKKPK